MKVAVLLNPTVDAINTSKIAGTEQVFCDDVELLKTNGYSVSAYAKCAIERLGIKSLTYAGKVERESKREKLAVIFHQLRYVGIFVLKNLNANVFIGYSIPLLALFFPRKTIVFFHGYEDIFLSRIFQQRYRKAHYLFCSRFLMRYYQNNFPFLTRDNCQVLYNAVDQKKFHPPSTLKKKNKIEFLFASAWVPQKGIKQLISAIKSLPNDVKQMSHFFIAGGSQLWSMNEEEREVALTAEKTLAQLPEVTSLGTINQKTLAQWYQRCDWLIVSSIWDEPFGLIVLESLISGTPVIAFRVGGIPEIVDESNSVLVSPVNAQALAKAITAIVRGKIQPKKKTRSLAGQKNTLMSIPARRKKLFAMLERVCRQH